MSQTWHDTAAQLTERSGSNRTYDSTGFSAILAKRDVNQDGVVDAADLQKLLNRMLGRYGQSISQADAQNIIDHYGAQGKTFAQFAQTVMANNGRQNGTYTRLMSMLLDGSGDAGPSCVKTDPFGAYLADYRLPVCTNVKQADIQTEVATAAAENKTALPNAAQSNVVVKQNREQQLVKHPATPKPAEVIATTNINGQQTRTDEKGDVNKAALNAEVPVTDKAVDPFASFYDASLLTPVPKMSPLNIYERVMRNGGCKEHCDISDVYEINTAIEDATGRSFEVLMHDNLSTDFSDARTALALGAGVWAHAEAGESRAAVFDNERTFSPPPVNVRGYFFQSPFGGEAKGYKGRGQDPQVFVDTGDHFETHHDDAVANQVAISTDTDKVAIGGLYSLYRNEGGSAQVSGNWRQDMMAGRVDAYQTLNDSRTVAIGGMASFSQTKTEIEPDILGQGGFELSRCFDAQPAVFWQRPHNTIGVGPYLSAQSGDGGSNQDWGLHVDYSQLVGAKSLAGFRGQARIGTDGFGVNTRLSSETNVFSRPTYTIGLAAQTGYDAGIFYDSEIMVPLTRRQAITGDVEYSLDTDGSTGGLAVGYLHTLGQKQNWVIGGAAGLERDENWSFLVGPKLNYLNARRDMSGQLQFGLTPGQDNPFMFNISVAKILSPAQ